MILVLILTDYRANHCNGDIYFYLGFGTTQTIFVCSCLVYEVELFASAG